MQAETSLVRVESQSVHMAVWDRERIDLVKKSVCPSGITDAEFSLFMETCKRSGLDPLMKEIFCVPRRLNIGTRDNPKWLVKHEAQPAEAGLLARADRFSDFGGIKAAAYYDGDDITVTDEGVVHKFNPAKRGGKLVGAWAQAFRAGRVFPVELVTMAAYQQPTPQWSQKPETMIVKCARAAALRRAYPNAFGGLYLKEEMPSEEFEHEEPKAKPHRAAVTVEAKAISSGDVVIPDTGTAPKTEPVPVASTPSAKPAPSKAAILCANAGHEWNLKGACGVCGISEKDVPAAPAEPKQTPQARARAVKVWKEATGLGWTTESFQAWTAQVLGHAKPSVAWHESEIGLLEAALEAEKPKRARVPGEEG